MYEYFRHPTDLQILGLIVFSCVAIILLFGAYRKKKINLNPKIIDVATSNFLTCQDDIYQAIRKGIDSCENWDDMHESYREILFYKKDYPDKEGQQDAAILLEAYNNKSSRLLSNFWETTPTIF